MSKGVVVRRVAGLLSGASTSSSSAISGNKLEVIDELTSVSVMDKYLQVAYQNVHQLTGLQMFQYRAFKIFENLILVEIWRLIQRTYFRGE